MGYTVKVVVLQNVEEICYASSTPLENITRQEKINQWTLKLEVRDV